MYTQGKVRLKKYLKLLTKIMSELPLVNTPFNMLYEIAWASSYLKQTRGEGWQPFEEFLNKVDYDNLFFEDNDSRIYKLLSLRGGVQLNGTIDIRYISKGLTTMTATPIFRRLVVADSMLDILKKALAVTEMECAYYDSFAYSVAYMTFLVSLEFKYMDEEHISIKESIF